MLTPFTMIKILTTGGTIDKVYFDAKSEYAVGDPMIGEVLREANVVAPFEIHMLMRKDSLELNDEDRKIIHDTILQDTATRFMITHGTDTMVQTAKALQNIPDKTIVLVGSLSPARFRNTDAVFNIGFACAAAQALPAGVYIAMNGRIFHPDHVVKNREANRFEPLMV